MRPITQSSEYAIRALTHLGRHYGGAFHLAHEMARELGMPAPFLTKILRPLVEQGLLESQRGRHGGFRLAHPPAEVSLHQIVASQEPLDLPRRCFLGQSECSDDRACPMHDFWKRASAAWNARLNDTTLADLLRFCEERPESGYPRAAPGGPLTD